MDRETGFLLPPDVRDWLAEDHLAWTVIDAVEALDRTALIAAHPLGGRGRRAYDPTMMLTLLIYAYAVGVRSSRQIEARCQTDVAFRVIAANQRPDHDTIAAFRTRHRDAFAALFTQVLGLCAEAGLVAVGVISIDGTKLRADASGAANRSAAGLDTELAKMADTAQAVVTDAEQIDAAEDAEHGAGRRGDEPPAGMRGREQRRARFAEARERLAAQEAAKQTEALEAQARHEQRLAEREAERVARGRSRPGPAPHPPQLAARSGSARDEQRRVPRVNTTDPDSRPMRTAHGFVQGFNAQTVVSDDQIILATDVVTDANDSAQLAPMTTAALANLHTAGIETPVETVLADTGYFNRAQLAALDTAHQQHGGPEPLVPPDRDALRAPDQQTPHPQATTRSRAMRKRLADPAARQLYRRRAITVEPVFGQIKNLLGDRFLLRGLDQVRAEFTLIATAHNLRKLHTATC